MSGSERIRRNAVRGPAEMTGNCGARLDRNTAAVL